MKFKEGDLVKLKYPAPSGRAYRSAFFRRTGKVIVVTNGSIGIQFLNTNLGHNLAGRLGPNGKGGWWCNHQDFKFISRPVQDKEYEELFI